MSMEWKSHKLIFLFDIFPIHSKSTEIVITVIIIIFFCIIIMEKRATKLQQILIVLFLQSFQVAADEKR